MKTFYEYMLNGKEVVLHKDAVIRIQIRKDKDSYETRCTFSPKEFGKAVIHYNGINVGKGYIKRLYCENLNRPVLARQAS